MCNKPHFSREDNKMRQSFIYLALSLLFCIHPDIQAALLHRYSFTNGDSGAVDSVGGQNGTLEGGATISGNAVQLNGTGAYVNLPAGLITGLTSVTFEAWFTCAANNGTWTRIWDFGDTNPDSGAGRRYVFFTPKSGSVTSRYAISAADADPGNHGRTRGWNEVGCRTSAPEHAPERTSQGD